MAARYWWYCKFERIPQMPYLQLALERGLLPDDETLKQLTEERGSLVSNVPVAALQWPAEPLRPVLIS